MESDAEGIRALAGRAQWISSPSPYPLGHSFLRVHDDLLSNFQTGLPGNQNDGLLLRKVMCRANLRGGWLVVCLVVCVGCLRRRVVSLFVWEVACLFVWLVVCLVVCLEGCLRKDVVWFVFV